MGRGVIGSTSGFDPLSSGSSPDRPAIMAEPPRCYRDYVSFGRQIFIVTPLLDQVQVESGPT